MTASFCGRCGEWSLHEVEKRPGGVRLRCRSCGFLDFREMRLLPLFIVTGASGTGKSAIVEPLRKRLPGCAVFETDTLWDSGGDWRFVRNNWLRVAYALAQSGTVSVLCGIHLPRDIDECDHRDLFREVHTCILHCDDATREARLRARSMARRCDEAFILRQRPLAEELLRLSPGISPPAAVIDTSVSTVDETVRRISDWIYGCITLDRFDDNPGGEGTIFDQGPVRT